MTDFILPSWLMFLEWTYYYFAMHNFYTFYSVIFQYLYRFLLTMALEKSHFNLVASSQESILSKTIFKVTAFSKLPFY